MMHDSQIASRWMIRHAALVRAGSTLLDVACGHGRHARFFASRGVLVTAVDRSEATSASLRDVENVLVECRDLEGAERSPSAWPYAPESFDALLVCDYLWRPTFERMLSTIKPGGLLLYETFMDGNERFGKPSRPDFLLRPYELIDRLRVAKFDVIAYEAGVQLDPNGQALACKQFICATRSGT